MGRLLFVLLLGVIAGGLMACNQLTATPQQRLHDACTQSLHGSSSECDCFVRNLAGQYDQNTLGVIADMQTDQGFAQNNVNLQNLRAQMGDAAVQQLQGAVLGAAKGCNVGSAAAQTQMNNTAPASPYTATDTQPDMYTDTSTYTDSSTYPDTSESTSTSTGY
jgi:hypothetical protein